MKAWSAAVLCAALAVPAAAAPKASKRARGARKSVKLDLPPPPPLVPLHPPRVSTEAVTFVWPPEGMTLAADNEFVFGSVASATSHFTINGATVAVHKDGGFIAWLPISAGTFTFHAELFLSSVPVTADRRIFVPSAAAPLPGSKPAIDPSSLSPKGDLELRSGDFWAVRMKATRGMNAHFRVGDGPWHPMREVNPRLGLYEALLQAAPGEKIGPGVVEYELGSGWSPLRVKGTAHVTAPARAPLVATVKANSAGFANIKTEPGQGFLIFPPPGTRMAASGRDGDSVRVDLSPSLSGWIDAKDVDLAEAAPPHAETGNVSVTETLSGAAVKIGLSERVPFEIVEGDALDALTVRLFTTVGHTNIVTYEGGSDFVDFVRWRQEATGVTTFTVRLKPGRKLWGWNARYDNGSGLRLDLRHPPRVANPRRPLEGWKVMLDPGHMPSASGATGPLGTKEMDANYAIAEAAAERLRRAGAFPLLTRGTTVDEVSLTDRPKQAVERGADVFVSIHNNALPDGSNPFSRPRGFTVFYYHAHSLGLGRAVHAAYASRAPVPDEGLQWDNLLVARLSAVPSILVENAYIIFPEQEALLNDPAFRGKLADGLVEGLRNFALAAGERKP
jgi:N-acetylmuramoyl-L-alanine amidase